MRITDVLGVPTSDFNVLFTECSQFIEDCGGRMLFRHLPASHNDVHRVKVRKKKSSGVDAVFNEAFDEMHPHLRQRAVFAYGELSESVSRLDPFMVFPIDGYKFMYSSGVANSRSEYERVLETISESVGDDGAALLIRDMLRFTYTHENLQEGIDSGAEVVIYNTPYYYAVRATEESEEALTSLGIIS